jgi:hypothetical protein
MTKSRPEQTVTAAALLKNLMFGLTIALLIVNYGVTLGFAAAARAFLLAGAVFAGSILVQLALAAAGAQLRRWLRSTAVLQSLNVASGLGILAFGLIGLWPHLNSRN